MQGNKVKDFEVELEALSQSHEESPKAMRFARNMLEKRNGCPFCAQVHMLLEKTGEFLVEEWIYLAHLSSAHGMIS